MLEFERIELDNVDLNEYYGFESKSVFTSVEWLRFLEEDNHGEIVLLRITKDGELLGYFTGLIIKKYGFKIFGSPFKGWSTRFMSFDVFDVKIIKDLVQPTIQYIFKTTGCVYVEIVDRNLGPADQDDIPYETQVVDSLVLSIDRSDEEILGHIKRNCRQMIRQFENRGATAEVSEPDDAFAREIYAQVCEVFAKQHLAPTFTLRKIQLLLKHVGKTDHIVCVTARDPEGVPIGTYIGCGMNKGCFGWCIASRQEYLWYRPNEYLFWYGMRYCRSHGRRLYDFSGVTDYKYKWNPENVEYLRIMAGKYPFLITMRNLAKWMYWRGRKLKGIFQKIFKDRDCTEVEHES
ncbi:GNAT family N-acetyltransferase [Alkalibacter rhizosphaerae]|uniref:GNAT family N-acetyltransferase n=1 Tax=Alkalibacter rhizosphaerae TaxID=2815577 RepID=A0A974XGY9_9FIRM|nr:GNAT family N-acetyltransferase [Alkalibacter rhizosphaerae]QSX09596.1 GNAT family N-acetyltransferase [Alkalibacter rhizosphaerae]